MAYITMVKDTHTNKTYFFESMRAGIEKSKKLVLSHGCPCELYKMDGSYLGETKINPKLYRVKSRDYKIVQSCRFIRHF